MNTLIQQLHYLYFLITDFFNKTKSRLFPHTKIQNKVSVSFDRSLNIPSHLDIEDESLSVYRMKNPTSLFQVRKKRVLKNGSVIYFIDNIYSNQSLVLTESSFLQLFTVKNNTVDVEKILDGVRKPND